jgi:two-component system cell cycle sensor histidine kinase/response regulator CckA
VRLVEIALLITDADARADLSQAVVALGHRPVPLEQPRDMEGLPLGVALVDGGPVAVAAVRACAAAGARLLAVGEDVRAGELLAAGADDVIPARCPAALLGARLRQDPLLAGNAAEMVEHANDIIYTSDLEGRFTFANQMAEAVTGYSRHELVGMSQERIVAPEYHELAREMTLAKLQGDTESTAYEIEIITRDGRRVPLEVSTRILYRDGKPAQVLGTARDITRRWRLRDIYEEHEAALRESERFLNAVVQSLPGYVYRARSDPQYTIEFVSDGIEETTGYSVADFMVTRSVNWPELVHPDDVAPVEALMRAGLDDGTPYETTYRIFRRSGEMRWVWEHGAGVYDETGALIAVEGFVTDVTERVRTDEALRETDRFLRAILENAPVITIALDREGRYTFTGGAAMEGIGLVPSDAVGHSIFERWAELPEVLGFAQRALEGEASSFDWDFEGRTLATNLAPTRDETGAVTGAIAVSFDNTERKRAERAVVDSEEKFRAFAEATSAALLAYRRGELFYANGAISAVTGYSVEELTRRGFFVSEVIHPEDVARVAEANARLMGGEEGPHVVEFRVRCSDGDIRWVQVSGSTFTLAGEPAAMITGWDITDRKQAEARLRASEEKFRAYSESTHSALWAFTEEGTFYANQAFLDLTGYTFDEVTRPGFYLDVVVHPEDRAFLADRRRRRLAGDRISPWNEHRIVTKSGDVRWLRMTSGYFSLDGQPAAVATAFDITDRRLAEEARLNAVAFSEATANSMPGIFYVITNDRRFVRVNDGYLRASGYTEDEIKSMSPLEFIPEQDRPAVAAAFLEVFERGESSVTTGFLSKDGTVARYFLTGKRVEYEGQICMVGVGIDISAQSVAEAARQQAEGYLRTVLAAAPVVVWAIDQQANLTLLEGKIPGYDGPTAAFIGKSIRRFAGVTPDSDNIDRALAGEAFAAVTENDGVTWETHFSPIRSPQGMPAGVIGVSIDVTERRRAEHAMLQAQKLESLGILAGGIAHDFNNLLVAILGNAGIALMELGPNSPARDTIQEIEKAGQRAADLARQMLAYSGKGKFVIERVNLTSLVEEMTHLLRVSIGKGITTVYNFDPHVPPIEADPTQVRQVVMNLVVNASDAIGAEQGTIAVSTSVSEETVESLAAAYLAPDLPAGTYACLEVTDTGCGMDEATLARVFDPFFTTKFTGRGLGLAAALGIIRGHRGAIQITSEVGSGTTFRVLLPASTDAGALAEPPVAAEDGWRGSGRILVADDDESVRQVTARAVELLGFEAVQAKSGPDAVALASQPGFVCAILDVTMPGMSGDLALAEIQRIAPHLPVVIMSGYSEQEAATRFAGGQPAAFVQKPYEMVTFRNVVRRVVETV